jgi:hypothetical protein
VDTVPVGNARCARNATRKRGCNRWSALLTRSL